MQKRFIIILVLGLFATAAGFLTKSNASAVALSRIEPPRYSDHPKDGPVTVLNRKRLGGYIEETAFITNGPYANHIAMSNGYDIFAVPVNANSDRSIKRLFNSSALDYAVPPKGMAYIESENAFAFVEGGSPTTLYLAD